MSFCSCETGQQNLGVLGCYDAFESVKKHIRVNTFDSEGNRNSIKLSELVGGKLTDAYILGKLTESDASKRWYITPRTYENVEPSRTDSTYEDFSSGARQLIDTGVKAFQGIIPKTAGVIAQKMNSGACASIGNFEIDVNGSLKGEMSVDGSELYPIAVAQGSFEAIEIDPVEGSSVQRIQITFQYAKTVNEGQLRIISSEDIDVSLLNINGSLTGDLTVTGAEATSSLSVVFGIDSFGKFGVVIPIEGQVEPTDWSVVDSGLNVANPSSVTEAIPGQYELTFSPPLAVGGASVSFVGIPDSATDQAYDSNVLSVNLTDQDAPVITLLGTTPVSVTLNAAYSDAGATALDSLDGDITSSIATVNNVDTTVAGTYTVTYNVTDSAGNAAVEVVRTVNVS